MPTGFDAGIGGVDSIQLQMLLRKQVTEATTVQIYQIFAVGSFCRMHHYS